MIKPFVQQSNKMSANPFSDIQIYM